MRAPRDHKPARRSRLPRRPPARAEKSLLPLVPARPRARLVAAPLLGGGGEDLGPHLAAPGSRFRPVLHAVDGILDTLDGCRRRDDEEPGQGREDQIAHEAQDEEAGLARAGRWTLRPNDELILSMAAQVIDRKEERAAGTLCACLGRALCRGGADADPASRLRQARAPSRAVAGRERPVDEVRQPTSQGLT
jgi:hypothetical protein